MLFYLIIWVLALALIGFMAFMSTVIIIEWLKDRSRRR